MKKIALYIPMFFIYLNCFSQDFGKAMGYFQTGKYKEASLEFETLLPSVLKQYGPSDTTLYSKILIYTAISYDKILEYKKAEQYYIKAKDIYEAKNVTEDIFYAVALNNLASLYKNNGNYKEAEPLFYKTSLIFRKVYGESHYSFATSLNNLADLYRDMGNYETAESLFRQALDIRKKVLGEAHPDFATSLNNLAALYDDIGKYNEAETLYKQCLKISKEVSGESDPHYATSLNNLAHLYNNMGNYLAAEPLYKQALEIRKRVFGESNPDYASSLNNLAGLYEEMGNYLVAESLYQQALEIRKRVLGESHPDYASSLNNLAGLYKDMGNYLEAESLYQQALEIRKRVLGESHPDYVTSLCDLALLYKEMGKYQIALPLFIESLEIDKRNKRESYPNYPLSLCNLAGLYEDMGNYKAAEPLYKQAIEILKKIFGESHPYYATSLNNLGILYIAMGKYPAAFSLYHEAFEIVKRVLGQNHPLYTTCLNNLAEYYCTVGNYQEAEPLYKQAIEIREVVLGKTHPLYATSLNNMAAFYSTLGNYTAAEPLYKQALDIRKKTLGEYHPDYASSLDNLAILYSDKGDYGQAIMLTKLALEIRKNIFGETHPDYATSLNNLALLYGLIRHYSEAESLYYQAIDLLTRSFGEYNPALIAPTSNLAVMQTAMGNYKSAEKLHRKVLGIERQAFGEQHPDYAGYLSNLAGLYDATYNYKAAEPLYLQGNMILNRNLQENFSFMSESEKEQFGKTIELDYKVYHSFLLKTSGSSPSINGQGYNNELLRKGMILASHSSLNKYIEESRDTALGNQYEQIRSLKQQINRILQQPLSERELDISFLEKQANELEKNLILHSNEYSLLKQQFSVTWQDIKKDLQSSEAVIEFFTFKYFQGERWTDSTYYCALVLRKEYEYPKLVYLFEDKQINNMLSSASASEEEIVKTYSINHEESKAKDLYKLIWGPIEPYLAGVNKVDFAVSGQLNRIAFHALPDESGNLLLNKYDLVQLSSTREVALPKPDKKLETIAIFGGIDYNTDTTNMLAMAREVTNENLPRSVYRSDSTSRNLNLTYLPGTMEEAKEVGDECLEKGIDVKLYSGKQATEEQFRLLGEKKSPTIIHIATHGFYFPEEKQKDREERMRFIQLGQQENQFVYSPDPLIRSGLAMAGANHAWKGEKIPDGVEDGILTARDVSQLNLLNTELVVLSACQTGLGDVRGSEGVYGLQRAFKMAGARYLMMSLWKVPDEATKEFMADFYGNLTSGMNIRDSYRNTQKEMNTKYPDDPFKWAAFVLVE